jgi:hypothetical protein
MSGASMKLDDEGLPTTSFVPIVKPGEKVADEVLVQQVAALACMGDGYNTIARKLKTTPKRVKKMLNSEECKTIIRRVGESALNAALSNIRNRMYDLSNKAMEVLEKHLDDGNLNAVALVLRTIDKEKNLPEQTGDTTINIVMPTSGKPEPITINATSSKESDDAL